MRDSTSRSRCNPVFGSFCSFSPLCLANATGHRLFFCECGRWIPTSRTFRDGQVLACLLACRCPAQRFKSHSCCCWRHRPCALASRLPRQQQRRIPSPPIAQTLSGIAYETTTIRLGPSQAAITGTSNISWSSSAAHSSLPTQVAASATGHACHGHIWPACHAILGMNGIPTGSWRDATGRCSSARAGAGEGS